MPINALVLLGWETWNQLGMPTLLRTLGFNPSKTQAAISVINRLADPTSEHRLTGATKIRQANVAPVYDRRRLDIDPENKPGLGFMPIAFLPD